LALIAEEVVEEWLNQQGFLTLRGLKLGVQEMDLLAVRNSPSGVELRHYEVSASMNPVSYISRVPKSIQIETGRAPANAKKRTLKELEVGVAEFIEKKFLMPKKAAVRQSIWPGEWSFHFVINEVRHKEELDVFQRTGVEMVSLKQVLRDLSTSGGAFTAASKDLVDLILMTDRALDEE
jgi:hypothetical protein